MGAAQFITYNVESNGDTVAENAPLSLDAINGSKVSALARTIDGSALSGYLVFDEGIFDVRPAANFVEEASGFVRGVSGERGHKALFYLLVFSLALAVTLRGAA